METHEITKTTHEWRLHLGPFHFDLDTLFHGLMVMLFGVMAYNIGVHDGWEMVKFSAYLSENGIPYWNGTADVLLKCTPTASAVNPQVRWDCKQQGTAALAGQQWKEQQIRTKYENWTNASLPNGWG